MPRIVYDPSSSDSKRVKQFLEDNEEFYKGSTGGYTAFTIEAIRDVVETSPGIDVATPYYIWGILWNPNVALDKTTILDPNNFIMFYQQFRNDDKVYYKADQYYPNELFMQLSPIYTDGAYLNTHENCSVRITVVNNGPSGHTNYFATNGYQIWNLTSHNALGNHGYPNIDWKMYVLESTVQYVMVDHNWDGDPIDFFFTKDPNVSSGFKLNFGCSVRTDQAPRHVPGEDDARDFYYTGKWLPTLDWVSPVSGQSFHVVLNTFTALQYYEQTYSLKGIEGTTLTFTYRNDAKYFPANINNIYTDNYIEGYKALQGDYEQDPFDPASHPFTDYADFRSFNSFFLGELINYISMLDPGITPNDVYTVLTLTFTEQGTQNTVQRQLDFSSLYESGVDPADDGSNPPGSSWDPLPGQADDSENPYLQPPPENSIPLAKPKISPVGLFGRTFAMTGWDVVTLSNLISTTDQRVIEEIQEGLELFGANPMNALVDLRLYPFDITQIPTINLEEHDLWLGRYDTQIRAWQMNTDSTAILDLGKIYIPEKSHSFLDYEPFTSINLYIPYIGTINLPPSLFMERTLSVRMIVDFVTGAATAVIYCNGIPMIYQNGIVGVSIAMTGENAAAYANGIIGNIVGAIGSAAGAIANFVSPIGNKADAVSGVVNAVTQGLDAVNSAHQIEFQQAGSNSPTCNTMTPQFAYVTIARPVKIFDRDDEMEYGRTNGFATSEMRLVGDIPQGIAYAKLNKLTMFDSGPIPTEQEVDMIKQALNNGFYNVMS